MPIDYSKWKTIEVSDDEDDTHPNIDTPSLFRWRHQARVERMEEAKQAREEVESAKKEISSKVTEIEQRLGASQLDEKERIRLELQKQQIQQQQDDFERKERELADKEKLQPWNVDTIGKEAWSKSIINKVGQRKQQQREEGHDEGAYQQTLKFFDDNEALLQRLAKLCGFDKLEAFVLEHPHLASENSTNWLTIEALNMAIEYKFHEMDAVAENCITLQYLLELAKSLNAVPTNTGVIGNFFKKIRLADPSYLKMYHEEVEAFKERLRKRAKDKRDAMIDEVEAEAKAKRIAESPGGLDPQEVLESLPVEMQDAFQTQSMEKMFAVAEGMDPEVFQHHLKRCIDSGLWIPNAREAAAAAKQAKGAPAAEEDA